MRKIDRALIEQREHELAKARADLQEAFVGIDDVIDELIDGIRVWYLMPEVLSHPVILNLWGMTRVGKPAPRLYRSEDHSLYDLLYSSYVTAEREVG